MINTLKIFDELKETMDASAARKIAETMGVMYEELKNTVTKTEFNELKEVVKELAEAQKRTEQRVEELVEAQKRTELRVEELAEAQKRTELRVEELAEAQKRTEEELRKLAHELGETNKQVGGLSITVGYTLENEAYKALPRLLEENAGITVKGRLKRQYIIDNKDQYIEVNIVGEASKNDKKVMIIGEGKSQLSKKGVDEFIRKKLNRLTGMFEEIYPILVTHMTSDPHVEEYAKGKGIALYYSYDF